MSIVLAAYSNAISATAFRRASTDSAQPYVNSIFPSLPSSATSKNSAKHRKVFHHSEYFLHVAFSFDRNAYASANSSAK